MKRAIVYGVMLLCIVLVIQFPHTMIQPGELVKAHPDSVSSCLACHQPFLGIPNENCISCHRLKEIGMRTNNRTDSQAVKQILFHEQLADQKCTTCHTDHVGRDASITMGTFSHEKLLPALVENCNGCHRQPFDNLHTSVSTACISCHNTESWKSSSPFNHELIKPSEQKNCTKCHQKPDDNYHLHFEENCNKCHTTTAWSPSTFDHSTYFQLDQDHNVKCITCHTGNNFNIYTCYSCHEHSESKTIKEHLEEGITQISNCVSCHKSSDEDDISGNSNFGKEIDQQELNGIKEHYKKQEKKGKKNHDNEND